MPAFFGVDILRRTRVNFKTAFNAKVFTITFYYNFLQFFANILAVFIIFSGFARFLDELFLNTLLILNFLIL